MRYDVYCCEDRRECVTAWTDKAIRLVTPTLRSSWATCALTVRSMIPSSEAISRLGNRADQQTQYLPLPIADFGFTARLNPTRRDGRAFNEPGQYASRDPHRSCVHFANRLLELIGGCLFRHVSLGSSRHGTKDVVIPISGSGDNNADFRPRRLQRRHPGVEGWTAIGGHQHQLVVGCLQNGRCRPGAKLYVRIETRRSCAIQGSEPGHFRGQRRG